MKQKLAVIATVLLLSFHASSTVRAQWVQMNGPFGGHVGALAAIGSNLIAGTSPDGVFLSTNSGNSWTATTGSSGYDAIVVSGLNLVAGTDESGMYLSTDNGSSWIPSRNFPSHYVQALAVIGNNLFAAASADSGLFLSTDNGFTRKAINSSQTSIFSLTASGTSLFEGTNEGIYRSTDSGTIWTKVDAGLRAGDVKAFAVNGVDIFAGTDDSGVFLSTNNGTSWTAVNSGLQYNVIAGSGNVQFPAGDTFNIALWVNALATNGANVYVGTNGAGIFRSTNNGETWVPANAGLPPNSKVTTFLVSGTNLFAGTYNSGGVFRSTDSGANWEAVNTGLNGPYITSFMSDPGEEGSELGLNLFVGSPGGIFISKDAGLDWTTLRFGSDTIMGGTEPSLVAPGPYAMAALGTNLFAGTGSGIFLSTDNGRNWSFSSSNGQVQTLLTNGTDIFAGTDFGVSRSKDSGKTWTSASPSNSGVMSLAMEEGNLFAGTFDSGVYVSEDTGTTWNQCFQDSLWGEGFSAPVFSMASIESNVYAGTFGLSVFGSDLNGQNWFSIPNSLNASAQYIWSFAVSGTNLFAGTRDSGVFLTTNSGETWSTVNSGFPLGTPNITLKIIGPYLFAGTDSGVWRRPLSEMITTAAVPPTPPTQQSIAAYPNPCTSSSTITFSCEESGAGEVTIVNLLGAQVARVFEGELSAGQHSFTWDASGAAPGMYECVVNVNGNVQRIALMCGTK